MKRILILMAVALFLTTFTASAASIPYHIVLTSAPTNGLLSIDNATVGVPAEMLLPMFNPPNPSFKLEKVVITFTLGWDAGFASLTNGNPTGSITFTGVNQSLFGSMSGPGTTGLDVDPIVFVPTSSITVSHGTTWRSPTSGFDTGSQTATWSITDPATLLAFTGIGNLTYDAYGENDFTFTAPSHAGTYGGSSEMGFTATLDATYYYDTPEPATMVFAGIGLLALGFLGRRFARR